MPFSPKTSRSRQPQNGPSGDQVSGGSHAPSDFRSSCRPCSRWYRRGQAATLDDWRLKRAFAEYDPQTQESRTIPAAFKSGIGAVDGAAYYVTVVKNSALNRGVAGNFERKLSLAAWRGKHVRLTLRFKTAEDIHANVTAAVAQDQEVRRGTQQQRIRTMDGWQTVQFVRDVPDDAADLVLDLGLYGKGTLWIGDVALEAADDKGAPSPAIRLENRIGSNGGSQTGL